ncbi:MAG TPA: hypothetical protein VD905_06190 [Flavobacteriales bacterium]|nr:hypothetical protein [Flavobacteriales bacterium]
MEEHKSKPGNLSMPTEKGLIRMLSCLAEKAIKEDGELVVTDDQGNTICVKTTQFKHFIQ